MIKINKVKLQEDFLVTKYVFLNCSLGKVFDNFNFYSKLRNRGRAKYAIKLFQYR